MRVKNMVVAMALLSLFAGGEAAAQAPVAFGQLGGTLKRGQTLILKDEQGRKAKGKLVSISGTEIVISRGRSFFRSPIHERFGVEAIKSVSKVDSLWNGALLGTVAGFAAGAAIGSAGDRYVDAAGGAILAYGAAAAAGGAVAGMAIDSLINREVFRSSAQRTVRVAPLIKHGQAGFIASIRF